MYNKLARNVQEYDYTEFISNVIVETYKDKYRCTVRGSKNTWYEFDNVWKKIENDCDMKDKLLIDVMKEYDSLHYHILESINSKNEDEVATLNKELMYLLQLKKRIKTMTFRTNIVKICAEKFCKISDGFEKKLNQNKYLLGFNNGIFDLKNNCFRKSKPEDYVTISYKYEYKDYDENSNELKEVDNYFNSIMIDKEMKNYLLQYIAELLQPNKQIFSLWIGNGSNGKSSLLTLIMNTFTNFFIFGKNEWLTKKYDGLPNKLKTIDNRTIICFSEIERPIHDENIQKILGAGFNMIYVGNGFPDILLNDLKIYERIQIIPFRTKFVTKAKSKYEITMDVNLKKKIIEWKTAFMWLLLNKYYTDYSTFGDKIPEQVTQFAKKYADKQDVVADFIERNIEFTGNTQDRVLVQELYEALRGYYKDMGSNKQIPTKKQMEEYLEKNYKVKIIRTNVTGVKMIIEGNTDEQIEKEFARKKDIEIDDFMENE